VVNRQHTVMVRALSLLAIHVSDHKNLPHGGGWQRGACFRGGGMSSFPRSLGDTRRLKSPGIRYGGMADPGAQHTFVTDRVEGAATVFVHEMAGKKMERDNGEVG
jgi:hypothetical protein